MKALASRPLVIWNPRRQGAWPPSAAAQITPLVAYFFSSLLALPSSYSRRNSRSKRRYTGPVPSLLLGQYLGFLGTIPLLL